VPHPDVAYRRLIVASGFAMIVFGACVAIPSVCQDAIGREFRLDFEQRGLLTTARMGALLVSLLLVGYLGDRRGKRGFLVWGLVVIGAGLAASATAGGYRTLLGAFALSGAGKGVMEALVNPLVAQLSPRGSARALNVINGLFSVGLVIAAIGAGEILQAGASWRVPFWVWIAPALVCASLFLTRGYPAVEMTETHEAVAARFLRRPLFWLLFAGMVLGGGCEAGLTAWGPNFVEHELGASARSGAWVMVLYGVCMALGRFASGGLVARIAPLRLMVGSAVACALATVALRFVGSLWSAWTLFALGGLFVACFWPTILSVASDELAAGSAHLFSLLAAAGIGGCVVFPWAMGALGDAFGLRNGVLILPASMVAQVAVMGVAARLVGKDGKATSGGSAWQRTDGSS